MDSRPRLRAVLQALLVTFLWSTSWVLIKIGLADIPPVTFAGLRYGLATLILLPPFLSSRQWASLRGRSPRTWIQLAVLGVLFYALTQGAQFVGLAYLPAVTVNLALSLTSVVVALLGLGLLAERPTGWQWLGVGLALAGAGVYFSPLGPPVGQRLGFAALVVGVLANAGSALLGRAINRRGDLAALTVTTISMGVGAALLLGAGVGTQGLPRLGPLQWGIVAWLAAVNTAFAFTLWNRTLQTLSAFESSVINNSMMVQIPILAVLFLGERLSGRELLGLGLVVVGVLLVQARGGHGRDRNRASGD